MMSMVNAIEELFDCPSKKRFVTILSMDTTRIIHILNILAEKLLMPGRKFRLKRDVRHIFGPLECSYAMDELVVVCVVRDGDFFIKSFIEYYFSIGVKHIFFLDNGSRDKTLSIIKKYENITLLSCSLPFKKYKFLFKRYLLDRFCRGRWSLCVDIDEFFDYPHSDKHELSSFLKYLNANSHTAVVTQMLDMFSGHSIDHRFNNEKNTIDKIYQYYDISAITKEPYKNFFGQGNDVTNKGISTHLGGIRKKEFKLGEILLTKHALVFLDNKIETFYKQPIRFLGSTSSHGVSKAKLGDFSCVLYHYKFHNDFYNQTKRAVREKNYSRNSYEYKRYLEVLGKKKNLNLKSEDSLKLNSVNELVDNGFLVVSSHYENWAKKSRKN